MLDHPTSDIAFSPAVKAVQTLRGSRAPYARLEAKGGFRTAITEDLQAFLAGIDTAYLATASADGQPYAQHRGGPKGFIQVLDERTLGFADFTGNRQFITQGNLSENGRAFLFLMDYASRTRIKLWGTARVSGDAPTIARLLPPGYRARAEQAIIFEVAAWDINCPQHIPQKRDAAEVATALADLRAKLADSEAEILRLRGLSETRSGATGKN